MTTYVASIRVLLNNMKTTTAVPIAAGGLKESPIPNGLLAEFGPQSAEELVPREPVVERFANIGELYSDEVALYFGVIQYVPSSYSLIASSWWLLALLESVPRTFVLSIIVQLLSGS